MLNNILYSHTHKMLLRIRGLLNADLMPPIEVKQMNKQNTCSTIAL